MAVVPVFSVPICKTHFLKGLLELEDDLAFFIILILWVLVGDSNLILDGSTVIKREQRPDSLGTSRMYLSIHPSVRL